MRNTKLTANGIRVVLTFVAAWILLVSGSGSFAATHYVDVNSPNPTPYTTWATAATVRAQVEPLDSALATELTQLTQEIVGALDAVKGPTK